MDLLILGGTQWLGRALAGEAVRRGHRVTCLARGEAGAVAPGAELVVADRDAAGTAAYSSVVGRHWDAVVDLTRQPGHARRAAAALAEQVDHVTFISSCSVYARHDEPGADESAELLPPLDADDSAPETYGEAKVACEAAWRDAAAERLLVVRPGLIGGPGDPSDRAGYWVARAARDDAPMLVPDIPDSAVQVIDVRDLVRFVLDAIERGLVGTFNAVGPRTTFADWLAASREVGGHDGELVTASPGRLVELEMAEWAGPDSLPLWIADPTWDAFLDRSNAAAVRTGLELRPMREHLVDALAWEREAGLDRSRRAGLGPDRERELIDALRR
ncbi:nucleoside-diphosphate-sugar epimerase [Agromyces flavus]|uniref:Nucleoside-diphosphate-sugar epimerase n=1 Tax=Agromyces flavus TaxID=589382 RepID=A0A1H1ZQP8_9MICO|nr:NAD-dependent epimerase/dehydratase family protein [Agromyces flavus]MCP2367215.1 nucleoside-diphosphate-sugar epimerase [Agromyces flavus]GGI46173.1 reductase [Agromyces flavus]SDT36024.1 Nucleoside-diphosphate-sugar epimerase [Agromyces flavus]